MGQWVYDLSFREVAVSIERLGMKPFVTRQIFQWLYQHNRSDIKRWDNISKHNRSLLLSSFDTKHLDVLHIDRDRSGTEKVLFQLSDNTRIESVIIKEKGHFTFCISTQVGCALACRFCATGGLGFQRNLTSGEILCQILALKKRIGSHEGKLNLVFMGMGEPLLNYEHLSKALHIITSPEGMKISPRNVTVSTAGILKQIERIEKDFPNLKLSFSLNASNQTLRRDLMPISRQEPLNRILAYFRERKRKHRITFEYVLIKGINDQREHANQVAAMLKGIPCKLNIIPFNEIEGSSFQAPLDSDILSFQNILIKNGFTVTVRYSKGKEIHSACGQLVGKWPLRTVKG
jgi:23S rRNA (adenine2503-C2)-methyltransferase